MSFLFGRARTRTNVSDLPRQAREHVVKLDQGPQGKVEELAKVLSQMKQLLQGTHGMLNLYPYRYPIHIHMCPPAAG